MYKNNLLLFMEQVVFEDEVMHQWQIDFAMELQHYYFDDRSVNIQCDVDRQVGYTTFMCGLTAWLLLFDEDNFSIFGATTTHRKTVFITNSCDASSLLRPRLLKIIDKCLSITTAELNNHLVVLSNIESLWGMQVHHVIADNPVLYSTSVANALFSSLSSSQYCPVNITTIVGFSRDDTVGSLNKTGFSLGNYRLDVSYKKIKIPVDEMVLDITVRLPIK